jgi:hypothetical protein
VWYPWSRIQQHSSPSICVAWRLRFELRTLVAHRSRAAKGQGERMSINSHVRNVFAMSKSKLLEQGVATVYYRRSWLPHHLCKPKAASVGQDILSPQ